MKRVVRISRRERPYVVLDKGIDDDPRLSYRAKGIHRRWMGLPDDWQFNPKEFCQHATEGRDAIQTALSELRQFGYAELWEARDHRGKVIGYEWFVYETPELPRLVPKGDCRGLFVRWICLDAPISAARRVSDPVGHPDYSAKKPQTGLPEPAEPEPVKPHVLSIQRSEEGLNQSAGESARNAFASDLRSTGPPVSAAVPGRSGKRSRRRLARGAQLPFELNCLRRLLMGFGFDEADAGALILEYGPRKVLIAVRNANWKAMQAQRPRGPNGWRGYIVAAMRDGYDLVEGVPLVENEDEKLALDWEARMMPTGEVLKRPERPADSSAEKARQMAALRRLEEMEKRQ